MNQLNQKIWALKIQIEAEKKLLNNGKGSQVRLNSLKEELKQCLKNIMLM